MGMQFLSTETKELRQGIKKLSKAPITGPGWLYDDHFEVDGGWSTILNKMLHMTCGCHKSL